MEWYLIIIGTIKDIWHRRTLTYGNSIVKQAKSIIRCHYDTEGLVQDCSISIANVMEILQSCTKPLIWASTAPYWIQYCIGYGSTSLIFELTTNLKHPLPHPPGWAIGCLWWVFWRRKTMLQWHTIYCFHKWKSQHGADSWTYKDYRVILHWVIQR